MDPYPYGAPYLYSYPPPSPSPPQPNLLYYLSPCHQYPPPQSHPIHYQNPNPKPHQNPPPFYNNHTHYQNPNPNPHQNPPPLYSTHAHPSSHHGDSSIQIVPDGGGWGSSLRVLLLHGSLDIWVCDARNLPNKDRFSKTIRNMVGNLSSMTSDPYVSIRVCGAVVGRTYVVSNEENPVWMQHFNIPVAHKAAVVEFLIKDNDVVGSDFIGNVRIPSEQICSGQRVEGTYPVLDGNGNHCNPGATLRISIQYVPIERYQSGIGVGPMYTGVSGTYFPLRVGGRVTLYQDAHVPNGYLPDLRLEGNRHYVHGQCWVDMFEAMSKAKHLIYIAGWSVLHTVQLVRDGGRGKDQSLGDLLKFKAQEGIRVLLLVWDDPTSRNILRYKTKGLMNTHDEETRQFFKHSSVRVLLCPRSAGKRHSLYKKKETGIIFTHHQKTVVVDADAGNYKRKIIAFVGGLDLCGGRFDTPKHSLFRTLETLHKDDFHQPNVAGPVINGPREPWHDLHCKIDGPAAYDVLTNFKERWMKASKRHGINKTVKSYDDFLLEIERIPEILSMYKSPYLNDTDPETWHVQILRSIDSNSAKGFPKDPKVATAKNLVCGKNVLIDMSIHTAYVKAIRSAQHFIYIENQYFLGSSFNWKTNKDIGANHLIPIEIALKIANKIKANERFSAYIVIPMWPEGNPTSIPPQNILFWQKNTMEMMYETIYEALKEKGLEETYKPQDYLNFFCLGNRETVDPEEAPYKGRPAVNSPIGLAQKNRRFMIYVHSKGMIVDDEYLIVGSANINQRSLDGTRDTEIAMAAYQPGHTWARKVNGPRGQIYGYRMSLWAEHMGTLEECFTCPESLECMRRVSELGEKNWKQFVADEVTDMKGHLLKYPVSINRTGKVGPLVGCEKFPDLGGDICGSISIARGPYPLTS